MKKYCGKLLIALLILIPCFLLSLDLNKVEATSNPFTVENIEQVSLSKEAKGDITKTDNNILKNTVVFHKVNDEATYVIKIKNNDENDYVINKITDTNHNNYITYEYDNIDEVVIKANETINLKVKAKYENPVNDTTKREQNIESMLSISYEEASKLTSITKMEYFKEVLIIILVVIAAVLALIIYYLVKNNKKIKVKEKLVFTTILLGVVCIPYVVKALSIPLNITISGTYYLNDQLIVDIDNNDTKVVPYKNTIQELPVLYKEGYTFIGWLNEDNILIDQNTAITKDTKLTPYFELNYYSIKYELNGGKSDNYLVFNYTINDRVVLNTASKEGYTFIGWTEIGQDNPVLNKVIPYGTTGNKTFIANYIPNEYKITYTLNGGEEVDNPSTYTIEQELELKETFKEGYSFIAWIDNEGKNYNIIPKGTFNDLELTASFEANKYIVNFDSNNDEVEGYMDAQILTYDEEINLNSNNFTKEEYRFNNWNTEEDGSGESYSNEQIVSNLLTEGEMTLYASWEKLLVGNLQTGKELNVAMKKLAGNTNAKYDSSDNKIKYIKRSYELEDNNVVVSTQDSDYPIYMWFNNDTIYYYTESEQVYLNSDSSYMFYKLQGLKEIDITSFNTYKVNNFSYMFAFLTNIKELDLNNFKTKNATNMEAMFKEDSKLENLLIDNFNTQNVKKMRSMFWNLSKLKTINISSFDTSNVEDMYGMFYSLKEITELNVDNFNTSKVKDMSSMFGNIFNITYLNLSNFDTRKVTKMENMFNGSYNIKYLNVSSFDTSNVTSMLRMFSSTKSIEELDLSSFDTSKVKEMSKMFDNMDSLKTIYVSDKFVVGDKTTGTRMFANDINIVGGNGTVYNSEYMGKEYAQIDDDYNHGYFTQYVSPEE